jgi:hypothetical protein
MVTSPSQIDAMNPATVRHVTAFEFNGFGTAEAMPYKDKCKMVDRPGLEGLSASIEKAIFLIQSGVNTVDIRPSADLPADKTLIFWLRYAELVVHHVKGGQSLKSYCFDSLIEPMMNLYYRIDKRIGGDELWRHYADSPEQFAAAFWAYSELHVGIPSIDKERRRVS